MSTSASFPAGTSFYGAGEAAGPLLRNGRDITFWNTDAYMYDEATPALYQSHPFVLAVLPDGKAVGLLANCSRRGSVRIGETDVEFSFEGDFELERIEADDPSEVCRRLAERAGKIELPALWTLGYHQCRWSYTTADEVLLIATEFRRRGIPCDSIWFDIDYMDRHRVFTWNAEAFPDPAGLTADVRALGLHTVAILDPGVAVDDEYDVDVEGREGGHFVLDEAGAPVVGPVWPGPCHFPDFTSERTRAWWAGRVERFVKEAGLDGLWCDMNEPALLQTPTKTLPEDVRHAGGSHAEIHNLYGLHTLEATRAGLQRALPDRRPFLLTRANFLTGSHLAATWTGDNQSEWEHLRWSIAMTLSLGLCGQPFAGADVPGFQGNPSPELFVRWFSAAAFLPFFRGHAEKNAGRKEPWVFGEPVMLQVKQAIERRQRFLPHLYTLFREASETGAPVVRPLFFADPADPGLRTVDDAFLVGESLLVAPVVVEGATRRTVRLPSVAGGWCDLESGTWHPGGTREIEVDAPLGALPMFARAGSILVTCEAAESAAAGFGDELTLHVYPDPDGGATGRLYEDAGEGFGYRDGAYREAHLEAHGQEVEERVTGEWQSPATGRRIVVYGSETPS